MTDIVTRVKRFLELRPDVPAHRFCAHLKYAPSTTRHVLDGSKAASAEMQADFERVLRLALAGEIFPQGAEPVVISEARGDREPKVRRQRDFYLTETVRRVAQVLSYCAEMAAIGVVTADYGVGKTRAVEAWRSREGRSIESVVFEFDSFSSSSRVDFIQALAELLDVEYTGGYHSGGRTLRAVCARLQERPLLLILDQCEQVRPEVLQVARQIWDRTRDAGVGIVLLAAPILMERLLSSRIRDLGALSSRVGVWAQLQGLSRKEMADILKREGVEGIAEDVAAEWYRAVGGSMRRLMASLDLVKTKHVARGRTVNHETLQGIAANLWGMSVRGEVA
jgi:type II secretory pathway predicted ATPase ExeA